MIEGKKEQLHLPRRNTGDKNIVEQVRAVGLMVHIGDMLQYR